MFVYHLLHFVYNEELYKKKFYSNKTSLPRDKKTAFTAVFSPQLQSQYCSIKLQDVLRHQAICIRHRTILLRLHLV